LIKDFTEKEKANVMKENKESYGAGGILKNKNEGNKGRVGGG
jgi:hypothetical protein